MKTAKTTNLYLRQPRIGWQNLGDPVPYRLRGHVVRRNGKLQTTRMQTIGKRQWLIVTADDTPFVFSTSSVKRLYGRTPPGDQ
jgi:hypothetical protein